MRSLQSVILKQIDCDKNAILVNNTESPLKVLLNIESIMNDTSPDSPCHSQVHSIGVCCKKANVL